MSAYFEHLLMGDMLTDDQKRDLKLFRRALREKQQASVKWCLCFDIATPFSWHTMQYINGTGWPVVSGNIKVWGGGEIRTENDNSSRFFSFYYREKRFSSSFSGDLTVCDSLSVRLKYSQRTKSIRPQLSESMLIASSKALEISIYVSGNNQKKGRVEIYRLLPPSSLSVNEGWKWKVSYQLRGCDIVVVAWEYEKDNLSHLCLFLFSREDWQKFLKKHKSANTELALSPVREARGA